MTELPDAAARRRALCDHDATLLVEAGAGSGKTAVMAGRAVLLLAKGEHPGHIAAITFTELAAGQLFTTICEYLDTLLAGELPVGLDLALADGLNDGERRNLAAARQSIAELTATTIHGFCQQLIRPYPVEAGLDPGAKIMDESEAVLAWQDIVNDFLRRRLEVETDDTALAAYVVAAGPAAPQRIETLATFLRRYRSARAAPVDYEAKALHALETAVDRFVSWVDDREYEEETTSALAGSLRKLAGRYSENLVNGCRDPRVLMALALDPPQCVAHTKGMTWRSWNRKGKWQDAAAAAGRSRAEGARLSDEGTALYQDVGAAWIRLQGMLDAAAFRLLADDVQELLEDYARYKRDAALIDFDDLLHHARRLLRDHDAVRDALAERYRRVLVDEFQDTDPLQVEILWRLCGEGARDADWRQRALRPGALFCVGDPKQAIYRFRGADVDTYVAAREAIAGQFPDNVLEITANFRSLAPILEWVNDRFAQPLNAAGQPGFQSLSPTKYAVDDAPGVARVEVDVDADGSSHDDVREAEAAAVAALCRRLIGSHRLQARCGEDASVRAGDIALLAPTGTQLWRYERALEHLDIPVATQAGKGFFRRQEIQDLIAVTRALADARDTVALGALLRGPLVGLTEEELLDIVAALPRPHGTERMPRLSMRTDPGDVDHAPAAHTLAVLRGLAAQAHKTAPFPLLAAAVEELRVRPILTRRHPGSAERALANVDLFLEMARPYAARGLRAFAVAMRKKWEDAESQVEGRPDAEEQAVHLITMHSAKGLQWPIVIPVNTVTAQKAVSGFVHRRSSDEIFYKLGPVPHASYTHMLEEEKAHRLREQVRLLYVACTRAEELLLLPRLPTGKSAWLEAVELELDALPVFDGSRLEETLPKRAPDGVNTQEVHAFAREAEAMRAAKSVIEWRRPSRHELADPEVEARESATQVFAAADEVRPAVEGGTMRGNLLHKLVEEVLSGESEADAAALEARALELLYQVGATPAADPATGAAPEELARTVMRTLELPQVRALRDRLQPELPLYACTAGEAGVEVATSGIADAVALDPCGSIEVIVDWKSDVAPSAAQRQRYRAQVRDYLSATGAAKGIIVYMTLGQVDEIEDD